MAFQHGPLDPSVLGGAAKLVGPGAPPPMKMMVARGLAPLPPRDLLVGIYQIWVEKDAKLSDQAARTVDGLPPPVLAAIDDPSLPPGVLDLVCRRLGTKADTAIRIARHPKTDDSTIIGLARVCPESVCEVIADNQQRYLRCPDIIAALYQNRHCRMSIVHRMLELAQRQGVEVKIAAAEEIKAAMAESQIDESRDHVFGGFAKIGSIEPSAAFDDAAFATPVAKSEDPLGGDPLAGDPLGGDPLGGDPLAGDPLAEDPLGGGLPDDPLAGLLDGPGAGGELPDDPLGGDPLGGDPLGGDPLGGDPMAAAGPAGDPLAAESSQAPEESAPAEPAPAAEELSPAESKASRMQQILGMNPMEKIRTALLGDKYDRSLLIRDSNKVVAMATIKSPKIRDDEVVGYSSNRSLDPDVIRFIASNREWVKLYQVKLNLVMNPKTPVAKSMAFLGHLSRNDIKKVSRSKNIPSALAKAAKRKDQARG